MTLAWVKFYMKENLHLDKLQVENCLAISLHLSAVNLDQLSVVFPLASPVPFHLAVLGLGVQLFFEVTAAVQWESLLFCMAKLSLCENKDTSWFWYTTVLPAAMEDGE